METARWIDNNHLKVTIFITVKGLFYAQHDFISDTTDRD